ncbi:MgtC/SapB family protein [Lacticaseibacillus zeae]|uniref:MgtC/SapB family protein n=1 Tax=Lacticaseibacillus zeae subsp. silagei TaxID=3068307 RepID=A0ABD7ZDP5_LACZE|nr:MULTISPECIES: MgtC/SapB family protein [Lacticaseibacillus]MDE3314557.1 MgtC/SapB family protein [Lacticaseibacillus zeae]OFR92117.1 methyltransferase [Lactobacillus sp. HMSC068F07]WLV84995.1 MgtC/SapB family protein [Lacticaseibacillus sp. NCIMB 15475]WLV87721.1 MgtC/SapB family protein [Lacticaseibacillus sp. NCIMB 15474]
MTIMDQVELVIRLLVAAFCGFAIGFERKNRFKNAGIRTHMIVALGSALIMIVSKYGFFDILNLKNIALDPSRVAAQIVSGVSFLGAGAILVRHNNVNGLTTAAGVWTTAAVGMAIGAKLYILGLSATALVLCIQVVLHHHYRWLPSGDNGVLTIRIRNEGFDMEHMRQTLGKYHIKVLNVSIKHEGDEVKMSLHVESRANEDMRRLLMFYADNPNIISIEF